MLKSKHFLTPLWLKHFSFIKAGYSLPSLGNQALTRKSISLNRTTKENRIFLSEVLQIKAKNIFSPHQIHSNKVIFVNNSNFGKGAYSIKNALKGDACITNLKNVLLLTSWADCIPVLIYESNTNWIASIHSGWRGTLLNIVKKTIDIIKEEIKKEGLKKESIFYASIGPGVRDCCYKVNEDFIKKFKNTNLNEFICIKNDGYYFDLSGSVYKQLITEGVKEKNIDFFGLCTCCNKDPYFFSYRRDKDKFEGQAAFIGIFE